MLVFNFQKSDYIVCTAASSSNSNLENVTETDDCIYCGKQIPKKEASRHKAEEEKSLHCLYCYKNFENLRLFRRHMYRYHKLYSCQICNVKLLKGAYEYHKRSVHSTRQECNACGKLFATRRSLMTHRKKIHLGERDSKWKCSICCYQAPDGYQLAVHQARHSKTPSFVCEQCGARRYTQTELRKHIQVDHGGGYPCDVCGRAFRCAEYTKRHRLTHDPRYEPEKVCYTCEECGKGFVKEPNFKRHLLKHKGQLPTFRCDLCGKQVSSKQSFAAHMRIHLGTKPFACSTCGKTFSEKRYLKWHERQHTQ